MDSMSDAEFKKHFRFTKHEAHRIVTLLEVRQIFSTVILCIRNKLISFKLAYNLCFLVKVSNVSTVV
jgi:hypothetical protein